ncbi:MAG: protoporphyrinogen oxidase [Legionellales bacterium RIFCSPHIGHO2_12_FULL_42_9]|nr:MAG: protoporphyrinogen oxidase [Legionellales bacterium RIFCSPHIGHO2_12_FULL_42_9]
MRRILVSLVVLSIAIYTGLQLNWDPGYVLIAVNQWTIETTLWFAALALIIGFIVGHSLLLLWARIAQTPESYHNWRSKRSSKLAQEKTRQGLIEFNEGYWSKAKNHLIKALPNTDTPLLNYLTAARAAQEMGDHEARDNYLREAQQSMPEAQIAVELTQAQLQLANKQWEQALATLRHLQDINPKHPYVLKLLTELYQEVKDWNSLIQLLPELKKYRVLTNTELDKRYLEAYLQALNNLQKQNQTEKITQFINELPKQLRHNPDIIAEYGSYLIASHQSEHAETILRESLKQQFNEKLIALYGVIPITKGQLQFAESFLKKNANSAELFLCLARLSATNQLWGKTKTYLEHSLSLKPTPAAYRELGKLHETRNEPENACTAYREGLLLVLQKGEQHAP